MLLSVMSLWMQIPRQGIDVLDGKIVSASIQTVKPGKPGQPGEKIGVFDNSGGIAGTIEKNGQFGIYGETTTDIENSINSYSMEVGYSHQVKEGKAEIYTVVNGTDIEKFEIVIEKVYPERRMGKGMVIRVTDPRLLTVTGGIVQGMSGSPIIQDSRIVGAVTHVFLNDPVRGYGIFMDSILAEMPEAGKAEKCLRQINKYTNHIIMHNISILFQPVYRIGYICVCICIIM